MRHTSFTALDVSASSGLGTINGIDLANDKYRWATFVINISTITGTGPTATFTIEGKDPISGNYYTILASTALAATGTTVQNVGPGAPVTANLSANGQLPMNFRVKVAKGGTAVTNLTATVSCQLFV